MANGFNASYRRTYWVNNTPPAINEVNLNNIENGISDHDSKIVTLDQTKADLATVNVMVKDVTFDEATGTFTITKLNGSKVTINTKLEKIAVNFRFDKDTQQIILTLDDGTEQYIDLSALITQYEFMDTDTVSFFIGTDGKVSAILKEGSVEAKHLNPDYLAEITLQVDNAEKSAKSAQQSAENAEYDAKMSQSYAVGTGGVRENEATDNSKYYKEQTANSAQTATEKAEEAATSATNAATSETNAANSAQTATEKAGEAATSATNAATSETNATNSAQTATEKAGEAATSAEKAKESENNAKESEEAANLQALMSESYFHGNTGIREGEDEDNVIFYYEKVKAVTEVDIATDTTAGLVKASGDVKVAGDGTMSVPKLADLEKLIKGASSAKVYENLGDMAAQLNSASLADFNIGTNILIKAIGVPDFWVSEIYTDKITFIWVSDEDLINRIKLSDGTLQIGYYGISFLETDKVDLTGIAKESYVNEKFDGAVEHSDTNLETAKTYTDNKVSSAANNQQPTFAEAGKRENINSGEKMSVILGKIRKWFSDLKTVAFSGSYKDLNDTPNISEIVSDNLSGIDDAIGELQEDTTNLDGKVRELQNGLDSVNANLANLNNNLSKISYIDISVDDTTGIGYADLYPKGITAYNFINAIVINVNYAVVVPYTYAGFVYLVFKSYDKMENKAITGTVRVWYYI